MFRPGSRRESVSLPIIGLCLLSAAILLASGTGLSSQTSPLNVDLTDTDRSVAHKGVALAVPFPGNVSVTFPPQPFTGTVTVTLKGRTDASWNVSFDPNPLVFTKTETQPFVLTVAVPGNLGGINTTTVHVNASAVVNPIPPAWSYPVDSDTATLTILPKPGNGHKPPGGNNTNGTGNNNTMPIDVQPPWYQTTGGALTAAAVVIVVAASIFFLRVRKLRAAGATVPKAGRPAKKPPKKESDD